MPEPFTLVYFRADGDARRGLGHLYRCLNLARGMRAVCHGEFLMESAPESFRALLAREGIQARMLSAAEAADVHTRIGRQTVVLDGYDVDTVVMRRWSEAGNLVAAIDDRAQVFFDCDVVVSHGPQNRVESYRGRAGCRYLVGPEYALLHPAFYLQPIRRRGEVRRLLVAFGGGDPGNAIRLVLDALDNAGMQIDVVLGSAYPNSACPANLRSRGDIVFHEDLDQVELARLMARADAAVAAGGGMSLELCATGVPALLVAIADNQVDPCRAFADRGMAAYCGRIEELDASRLRRAVLEFLASDDLRQRIVEQNRAVFISSGVERVSQVLRQLMDERAPRMPGPILI